MATATPLQFICAQTEAAKDLPLLYDRSYGYKGLSVCDAEVQKQISHLNRWYDAQIRELMPLSYVSIAQQAKNHDLPHPVITGYYGHHASTSFEGYQTFVPHGDKIRISGRFVGFEVIVTEDCDPIRVLHLESPQEGLLSFRIFIKGEGNPGKNHKLHIFGSRHSRSSFYSYEH